MLLDLDQKPLTLAHMRCGPIADLKLAGSLTAALRHPTSRLMQCSKSRSLNDLVGGRERAPECDAERMVPGSGKHEPSPIFRVPLNFSRRLLWRLNVPPWVGPGMRVSLRGRRYRNRSCEGPAMPGRMRGWSGPTSWAGYIEDRLAREFLTCGKDIHRGSIDELRGCT